MTIDLNDILWSTRGLEWGFRILRHPPGDRDWLPVYDGFFRGTEYEERLFMLKESAVISPQKERCIVLRFTDPQERKDRSGRLIPHEIIILSKSAEGIETWEQARDAVWPLIEKEYAELYDANQFRSSEPQETNENTPDDNVSKNRWPDSSSGVRTVTFVAVLAILGSLLYFYFSGILNVRGTVVFSDGTPLREGSIVWTNESTTRTAPLDNEGNFRMSKVKPGKYAVSFTGEAANWVDAKYLDTKTSGLTATIEKTDKPGNEKEFVVNFSIEKIKSQHNKTP